jgi:hypothetical protein
VSAWLVAVQNRKQEKRKAERRIREREAATTIIDLWRASARGRMARSRAKQKEAQRVEERRINGIDRPTSSVVGGGGGGWGMAMMTGGAGVNTVETTTPKTPTVAIACSTTTTITVVFVVVVVVSMTTIIATKDGRRGVRSCCGANVIVVKHTRRQGARAQGGLPTTSLSSG